MESKSFETRKISPLGRKAKNSLLCAFGFYGVSSNTLGVPASNPEATSLERMWTIAGEVAFSLGMIADYMDSLVTCGAAFYRNLFWEAGLVGRVLYLEAEEAGIRSTGIGCYFDEPVHEVFGISSRDWQSFYHFTVGGPVEDKRLTTLPAYKLREDR